MGEGAGLAPVPGCLLVSPGVHDAAVVADRCWLLGATAISESADRLEVGFGTAAEAAAAAEALGEWWPGLEVSAVDAGAALESALAAWAPYARPFRLGRIHVRPAWLDAGDDPPRAGERVVVVDPVRAFGYDHPSTVACLAAVDRFAGPGRRVVDVGCGSGILAVAAAVLGADAVGVDTDPAAVAATLAAATANGVAVEASATPVGEVEGPFDLVLANIGAAALVTMAPTLARLLAPVGRLVLAGLLVDQAGAVAATYEAVGLHHLDTVEREGWASPSFRRKP